MITEALTFLLLSSPSPDQYVQAEHECLIRNIYHEARGESMEGKMAVGYVTLRRMDALHRGKDTICGVVYDPLQFSWTAKQEKRDTEIDKDNKEWFDSARAAWSVLYNEGEDTTKGAIFYVNMNKLESRPAWLSRLKEVAVIGNHTFFK